MTDSWSDMASESHYSSLSLTDEKHTKTSQFDANDFHQNVSTFWSLKFYLLLE